jgi:hypothetical protein
MKSDEFHKPFIKSLILIAIVTMFTMVISDKLMNYYNSPRHKTPIFTSQNSYNEAKAGQ